ncbi:N-acetyl-gamma-glutamyl-phosphate reductase [Lewinellaceae bacterium SD302]|nr:N-acetyl-gamma-glutamyl-phosphate reductase [Lewinellaceae bacterium SD302]
MIKAGIIGGAGYTAGELLRLLVNHPEVEIAFVQSNSQAGKPVTSIHLDLSGWLELDFVSNASGNPDVLFICAGHGKARKYLEVNPPADGVKIVDLSRDFRLAPTAENFVYGLPELNREQIQSAQKIANPGCFATCIQLALLPLAKMGLLRSDVHVNALTGSTGAGQQATPTTHFSWRDNNVSIYKAFTHQHLGEIHQSLEQLQADHGTEINFLPVRGSFSRGIFASSYTDCELDESEARQLYADYYATHPFVSVVAQSPSLKQVVNTNNCHLFVEKHGNKLLVISIIDNLLKGASGQAVQNMNLLFGLEETLGLRLKASAF